PASDLGKSFVQCSVSHVNGQPENVANRDDATNRIARKLEENVGHLAELLKPRIPAESRSQLENLHQADRMKLKSGIHNLAKAAFAQGPKEITADSFADTVQIAHAFHNNIADLEARLA